MWYKHHSILHHAFTGTLFDPDSFNFFPFIRKHIDHVSRRYWPCHKPTFKLFVLLLIFCFPGMWMGQALSYFVGARKGRLWGMDLTHVTCSDRGSGQRIGWGRVLQRGLTMGMITWLLFTGSADWMIPVTYCISANISYAVCILPDHDTLETAQVGVHRPSSLDWGEIQVRNSANFSTSSSLLCHMVGGINFQIEHHLFPSICHVHYPHIAPIVRATCMEFNIPYTCHPSILSALRSALSAYEHIATTSPKHE